jgi:hypothetical protein
MSESKSEDIVTVIRLVALGSDERGDANAGLVTAMGQASMRTDGDSIFLVTHDASALRRMKVGDIVHWVAERFGVVWLTERRPGHTGAAE